ncbi:general transcription factor II-I repeat domain-containing protein 2-like isoform X2 [Nerophis lumbriciformis]|uniref:general transcription factor II-I repeat domain-containing protein 2-like isoform X2 n=1 Tax=Nerophis lumbriciformis TaxID=546530 RepID=UPI003BA9ED3E
MMARTYTIGDDRKWLPSLLGWQNLRKDGLPSSNHSRYTPKLLELFSAKGGVTGQRIKNLLMELIQDPSASAVMKRDVTLRCHGDYMGESGQELISDYCGKKNTVCELMSEVPAFQRKLELFKSDIQEELLHFPKLLELTKGEGDHQCHLEFLEKLIANFKTRFDGFILGKQVLLFIENPFLIRNVSVFSAEAKQVFPWARAASLQTELIDPQESVALKEAQCDAITFWSKLVIPSKFPLLHKMACHILTMFGSTYSCESAFSTMNIVKNKYSSRLTNEHLDQCLRLAITPFVPKFKVLASTPRAQFSH